mmetsp:Transcript_16951/g.28701  ORF Transcript_16951/g.28701 Transcript_16951/m.28701 type:complete len:174 (-) Transcript_16951:127-648(-)
MVFSNGGESRGQAIVFESASQARAEPIVHADPSMVQQLADMGFTKSQCKAALKKFNNNMERSLDQLLNNGSQFIGLENSDDSIDQELIDEQRILQQQIEESMRVVEGNEGQAQQEEEKKDDGNQASNQSLFQGQRVQSSSANLGQGRQSRGQSGIVPGIQNQRHPSFSFGGGS